MEWTKDSPLEKGWYFFRQRAGEEIIVSVNAQSFVSFVTQPNPHSGRISTTLIETYLLRGEWAGPIPEPTERQEG